jgi:hypothetical protein
MDSLPRSQALVDAMTTCRRLNDVNYVSLDVNNSLVGLLGLEELASTWIA